MDARGIYGSYVNVFAGAVGDIEAIAILPVLYAGS